MSCQPSDDRWFRWLFRLYTVVWLGGVVVWKADMRLDINGSTLVASALSRATSGKLFYTRLPLDTQQYNLVSAYNVGTN